MSQLTAKRTPVLLIVLGLLLIVAQIQVTAMRPYDCCYFHSRKPVPMKVIKNYTVQHSSEMCDIDAIIFHTKRGAAVCANPEDKWVKRAVKILRLKAKGLKPPQKKKKKTVSS